MNLALRHCSMCGRQRPFEQPPCPDGHGDDCPECACAMCGFAILVGLYADIDAEVVEPVPYRTRAA